MYKISWLLVLICFVSCSFIQKSSSKREIASVSSPEGNVSFVVACSFSMAKRYLQNGKIYRDGWYSGDDAIKIKIDRPIAVVSSTEKAAYEGDDVGTPLELKTLEASLVLSTQLTPFSKDEDTWRSVFRIEPFYIKDNKRTVFLGNQSRKIDGLLSLYINTDQSCQYHIGLSASSVERFDTGRITAGVVSLNPEKEYLSYNYSCEIEDININNVNCTERK